MSHETPPIQAKLSRQELHDLVWSEPVTALAPRFGVSNVALSKLCHRYDIPLPPRGYWAKLAAGRTVAKTPLPPRGFGIEEYIHRGRQDSYYRYAAPTDLADLDLGPPPVFSEPAEEVIAKARRMVGSVTVPRDLSRTHPAIDALLQADEARRRKYLAASYRSPFDAPLFDSPFEKRRLRLMNGLLRAFQRLDLHPSLSPRKDPTHVAIMVGHQHVSLRVDEPKRERHGWRANDELTQPASTPLTVTMGRSIDGLTTEWKDSRDEKVEAHITEMVVSAFAAGELAYRLQEIHHHEWLVERKAQLIEERRRQKEEAERLERERLAALQQARIEQLLDEADRYRKANDIRAYVRAALAAPGPDRSEWAAWARAQADALDPLRAGPRETV
jgi:hypothetical protein